MSGKCRPHLVAKTLENVKRSILMQSDKNCIQAVFERYESQKAVIERLKAEIKFSDYLEYETTNQIKAEAYKECMARVEDRLSRRLDPELYPYIKDVLRDELNKMVGGSNEKT